MSGLLPAGFAALEPFAATWGADSTNERMHARATSSMAEIRAFYETALQHAEAAMAHCEQFPLDTMPDDAARLYRIVLGLVQAAVAVELHGQPRAPGTPWPNSIRIERGVEPFG